MRAAFERGDLQCWGYDARYARRACDPAELLAGARSVVCIALPYATRGPATQRRCADASRTTPGRGDYHRALARAPGAGRTGDRRSRRRCGHGRRLRHATAGRARVRGARGFGMDRQAHQPHRAAARLVRLSRRDRHHARAPAGRAAAQKLRCLPRCIDACPTRRLRGDYTIDANRCISDLTQRTDAIPRAMRPLVGEWVWGCDLCQVVCPPTREAGARWRRRAGRPPIRRPPRPALVELLRLRSGAFKRRYRTTAMGWRGAAVLRRNAAVALGNALDRSAVGPLIESLERRSAPDGARARRLGAGPNRLARSPGALRAGWMWKKTRGARRDRGGAAAVRDLRRSARRRVKRLIAVPAADRRRAACRHGADRRRLVDGLLDRMAALNPHLRAFTATLHAHVAMRSFPFLSADLVGTYYFKAPDKNKVVFTSGVPLIGAAVRQALRAHRAAFARGASSTRSRSSPTTARRRRFGSCPRKHGNVDHIDATADDRSATVTLDALELRQRRVRRDDQPLRPHRREISWSQSQTGHVQEPGYVADITSTIDGYKLNPDAFRRASSTSE